MNCIFQTFISLLPLTWVSKFYLPKYINSCNLLPEKVPASRASLRPGFGSGAGEGCNCRQGPAEDAFAKMASRELFRSCFFGWRGHQRRDRALHDLTPPRSVVLFTCAFPPKTNRVIDSTLVSSAATEPMICFAGPQNGRRLRALVNALTLQNCSGGDEQTNRAVKLLSEIFDLKLLKCY